MASTVTGWVQNGKPLPGREDIAVMTEESVEIRRRKRAGPVVPVIPVNFTRQAVRDYRAAWASIRGKGKAA